MAIIDYLSDTLLPVEVFLGETETTVGELKNLSLGKVFILDRLMGEPQLVYINGKLVAEGDAVEIDESNGIRILKLVQNEGQLPLLPSSDDEKVEKAEPVVPENACNEKIKDTPQRKIILDERRPERREEVLSPEELDMLLKCISSDTDDDSDDSDDFSYISCTRKIRIRDFREQFYFTKYRLRTLSEMLNRKGNSISDGFKNTALKLVSVEEKYEVPGDLKKFAVFEQRRLGHSFMTIAATKSVEEAFNNEGTDNGRFRQEITNIIFSEFEKLYKITGKEEAFSLPHLLTTTKSSLLYKTNEPFIELLIQISIDGEQDFKGSLLVRIPSGKLSATVFNKNDVPNQKTVESIPVILKARFGKTRKSLDELNRLGEGTIIELDSQVYEDIDLIANGILVARGHITEYDEFFAVEVTEVF